MSLLANMNGQERENVCYHIDLLVWQINLTNRLSCDKMTKGGINTHQGLLFRKRIAPHK